MSRSQLETRGEDPAAAPIDHRLLADSPTRDRPGDLRGGWEPGPEGQVAGGYQGQAEDSGRAIPRRITGKRGAAGARQKEKR